jgi:c-di-GMP-binding flagellar brake protein YcgR
MKTSELQPVARLDVRLGRPIPFPVYDRSGRLLLAAGQVVNDARALDALIERGLYCNPRWTWGNDSYVRDVAIEDDTGPSTDAGYGSARPSGMRSSKRSRPTPSWRMLRVWSEGSNPDEAMTVKLIGVHEGKTLVITAPERDGKLAFVKEGNVYCFRGFSGELVYEFKAAVHKTRFEPYPYLHVDWPQDWQMSRRRLREARRVTVEVPCIVYPDAECSETFVKAVINDLSVGGASIVFKDRLPKLQPRVKLAFRLQVAGQQVLFEATAEVARQPDKAAAEPSAGLHFDNLSDTERLALHAYVYHQIVREIELPLHDD